MADSRKITSTSEVTAKEDNIRATTTTGMSLLHLGSSRTVKRKISLRLRLL